MRAAAGFDRRNPAGGQRLVADEKLRILFRKDVVGDDGEVAIVAEGTAERQQECRFPAPDRPADANGERPLAVVPRERRAPRVNWPGPRIVVLCGRLDDGDERSRGMGFSGSGLKQPRYRRSCDDCSRSRIGAVWARSTIVERRTPGFDVVEHRRALSLQPLRLVAPDDPQPHGRGRDAASGLVQEQPLGRVERDVDSAPHGSSNRREVTAAFAGAPVERHHLRFRPDTGAGGGKRPPLHATRAVGHRVGQIRIASASSSGRRIGSRCAAITNGNADRPACRIESWRNRRKPSRSGTSPHCHAASSPDEWAKPPVGNAESASCHSSHEFTRNSQFPISNPKSSQLQDLGSWELEVGS